MIDYHLEETSLPGKPHVARVQIYQKVSLDMLLDTVRRHGGVLISSETETALRNVFDEMMRQVKAGNKVVTPWFHLYPGIQGVFESEEDRYDDTRHQVVLKWQPGARWKMDITSAKVRRVDPKGPARPRPVSIDYRNNNKTRLVIAGRVASINGERLKIGNVADMRQGVFFINDLMEAPYRVEELITNEPKLLRFVVPEDIPEGMYEVQVCSTVNKGNVTVQQGELPHPVEVARP